MSYFSRSEDTFAIPLHHAAPAGVPDHLAHPTPSRSSVEVSGSLDEENLDLREEVVSTQMFEEIVGSSEAISRVTAQIMRVAPSDATVLITGESGTGKELIARAIHRRSRRSRSPFVRMNCAATPASLITAELFGYEKGAFTGANQRHAGRFGIPVDARVIAATNCDLPAAVRSGKFRLDLFYRLNVFPIHVPSLRERPEDILLLAEYFIERYAAKVGKAIRRVDKRTAQLLESYHWPGNIRELQNVIERAMILCDAETFSVDEAWLQPESKRWLGLQPSLMNQERELIEAALEETRGRVSGPKGAARRLGIPRTTLESKIKSLGINKHGYRFDEREAASRF